MDGSFPLQRDPAAASPPPNVAGWQQEIDNARAGHPPTVSTKAAAYYCGVHYKTFLAWVREGWGPEPIKNPVRPGTTAQNQKMRFTLEALDAFQQIRSGGALTRGTRTDADTVRREADRIQAAIDLKAAEDTLEKARARARRLGVVCFASVSDLVEPQPWARVDGRLLGHAWAVDAETFEAAGDDLPEATLEEALAMPWSSQAERAPYEAAFLAVLVRAREAMGAAESRQRAQDLEEKLAPADAASAPVRPFGVEP